jgi:ketosteroid isomerase-like protein
VTQANADTLRQGYEALNQGDFSVVLELLDPDMEWHEPAGSPEAGDHHGRDTFERFLRSWIESFEDFRVEPEQVVERGDRLVAVVHQSGRGRASGAPIEIRLAHVWTIKDGRAIRWESMPDVDAALSRSG